MAGVDYVENPDSFSLYEKSNGDNIGVFGDDHEVSYGGKGKLPANEDPAEINRAKRVEKKQYISDYVEGLLEKDKDLHVYVEAPSEVVTTRDHGVNRGFAQTRALREYDDDFKRRIHNIDKRNGGKVIPHDLYFNEKKTMKDFNTAADLVRKYVSDRAPEMLKKLERDIRVAKHEYGRDDASKQHALRLMMNTAVEADMIKVIRQNPDNASHMLFYVGSKHKDNVEEEFLDKPRVSGLKTLYKRRAKLNDPIAVSRFIDDSDDLPKGTDLPEGASDDLPEDLAGIDSRDLFFNQN
jgi:hypothetical protein